MMNFLLFLSITTTLTCIFLNHPLSFGLTLLIQTLLISLITGMVNYNFWFSYILFLIMVGGMLILFIYMTSVASNEKFKFSLKIIVIPAIASMIFTPLIFTDKFFTNTKMNNYELTKNVKEILSFNKLIEFPNNLILTTLIIYLLITLIMVVKITNIQKGPLRQMF